MPSTEPQAVYKEYTNSGMNRNVSPFVRVPGQHRLVVNADQEKVGVLTKRRGYTSIFSSKPDSAEILSLIPFEVGTVRRLIMINAAGKLYSANIGTDTSWGAAILTGLSTTARWGHTVMSDASGVKYMFLGNGVTTYNTSDGVTFTSVSGAPLGKYWATLLQRVFTAGVPADPDVLHWSETGDGTGWSAVSPHDSSSTPMDKYSKGTVKGVIVANNRIVAYKDRILKRWDGSNLVTPQASDGLCAPYSLSEIKGIVFSLGYDNIYIDDGGSPTSISQQIEDLVRNIDRSSTNIERICGVGYRNCYYLSVGNVTGDDDDTITNAWIVFDFYKSTFVLYSTAVQPTAMCKFINAVDGNENLYFGDADGNVYQMFSGEQDDTTDVEMIIKSHRLFPGGTGLAKQPVAMTVVADPSDEFQVTLIGEDGNTESIGSVETLVTNFVIGGEMGDNNRSFEVVVTHAGKGRPSFYGYELATILSEQRIDL
jgi:hypothetical protein